jgi:hypothetical protein
VVRLLRGLTIGAVLRGNNPHGQPELQRVRGRVVVGTSGFMTGLRDHLGWRRIPDVVVGRLQQRSWTAEDGSARSTAGVVTEELGASLRWAAATTRTTRSQDR